MLSKLLAFSWSLKSFFNQILQLNVIFYNRSLSYDSRAKEMVDVLQNYMQDAISLVRMHRTDGSNHEDPGTTNYGTKRRATENQRRRNQQKDEENKSFDQSLFQIKESTLQSLHIPSKPLNGLKCKFCAPSNQVSVTLLFTLLTHYHEHDPISCMNVNSSIE